MAFRRRPSFVWGALFALVAGGCATGIVADPDDGGDPGDAPIADMDSGTDSGAFDAGMQLDTGSKADTGTPDTGPPTGACSDWAGPTVAAGCTDSCNATTHICGANGCYNMWWCKISTGICASKPPSGC